MSDLRSVDSRAIARDGTDEGPVHVRVDASIVPEGALDLIRHACEQAIAEDKTGLQVAVYVGERLAVEAWGGFADRDAGTRVESDTPFNVFSVTKAITATAAHLQIDRGKLSLDARISDYWPEFGRHEKGSATVRDALTHRTGIPQMPVVADHAELLDWELMADRVADLAPLWPVGTRTAYHAHTFGWIIGELVRRTDDRGRSFGSFVVEEVATPLDLSEMWLEVPESRWDRIARVSHEVPAPPVSDEPPPPPNELVALAMPDALRPSAEIYELPEVRKACLGGAGGVADARSLAGLLAALSSDGKLGQSRILSPGYCTGLSALQSDERDEVNGMMIRKGLGYWMGGPGQPSPTRPMGENPHSFGHPGTGGSIAWADPDIPMGAAIVRNRLAVPSVDDVSTAEILGGVIRQVVELCIAESGGVDAAI